ncbi:MAG: dockerin type I repeat-containing protein [Clostridiaceae bacterium]|nr:dockerin type I repeat-containing protein [Clostridiaceae bacterium]
MKKLLSVLLSVAMIIGCLSICFNAFAIDNDEFVAKFNEATKKAASEFENEDGTMNYASGYAFEQVIDAAMANVTGDEERNELKNLVQSKYPEFPDYDDKDGNPNDCFTQVEVEEGIFAKMVNFTAVARIASGVEEIGSTKVNKYSNGADTLGDYALKEAALTADMIDGEIVDEGAGAYTVNFKDVDISADESVEDSAIAAVLSKYPALDGMDDRIIDEAASRDTGLNFKDLQIQLTGITMRVVFNDDDTLQQFVFQYKIKGTATIKFVGETLDCNGNVDVKVSYTEFENVDSESDEMNVSELVKRINEATAYAVDSKAGYIFSRSAQYPMGVEDYAHFSINLTKEAIEENMDPDSMVAGILSGLDIYGFINSPANIGITNVLITLDDVTGIRLEGLKWVCNCADCPECDCDECTAAHPCTCTGCHCHYELIDSEDLLGKGLGKVSEKLQDVIRDGVKSAFDFGVTGKTVPMGKDGKAILGERAFKATSLNVNDIDTTMMAPECNNGVISFMLPVQVNPDENSALAHLTDDYATAGEMMDAWKIGFLNTFGVDPFAPSEDGSNTGVTYQNIKVNVKFEEADDENPFGNGKIERMNTFYYCMTNLSVAGGIITGDFGVQISNDYDEFKYNENLEKGDADVSGRVSIIDAKLVLKHIVKTETITGLGFELADMDENGDLNLVDAKAILQKIADDAAAAAGGSTSGDTSGYTSGDKGQG